MCRAGEVSLVSSEVLRYEISRNPNSERRSVAVELLGLSLSEIQLSDIIVTRAKELETRGFKALDALHLACADTGLIDYFCTCDDRLLRRTLQQSDLDVRVVGPLELLQELIK